MDSLKNKDFCIYPKFRHNLWLNPANSAEITYLTFSEGTFEIPIKHAKEFLSIRKYCTGYNTVEEISKRTRYSENRIEKVIQPFQNIGMNHLQINDLKMLENNDVKETIFALANLFGNHLAETSIMSDIMKGDIKKEAIYGWLCETYHYLKFYPKTLRVGARYSKGAMKNIIEKYASQEYGHEIFLLKTLQSLGFKKEEIEESTPLVSTRTIQYIMEDLFKYEPISVFIVANVIEAETYNELSKRKFSRFMNKTYGFASNTWDSFFEHIKIDHELQHQKLLQNNANFLEKINLKKLDSLINKLHDLKHAFDLQKLEILTHYSKLGSYIPRQFVGYYSI